MKTMPALRPQSVLRTRPPGERPLDLSLRLSRLYELAQDSEFIFGSPLGPLDRDRRYLLPRFVYFGPQTSEASPRIAVIAGLGRHDLPAARALTAFVESLATRPDIGHGLNLTFVPVVNVLGLLGQAEERDLADEDWSHSAEPEIALLADDARGRGYQSYIRIVTTTDDEPTARLISILSPTVTRSEIEVFNSLDFEPWSVSFEAVAADAISRGPLSLVAQLPVAPFEVELGLPAEWSQFRADAALAKLLKHLITRYRGFLAYGQNL
jgi:hypothetical protein